MGHQDQRSPVDKQRIEARGLIRLGVGLIDSEGKLLGVRVGISSEHQPPLFARGVHQMQVKGRAAIHEGSQRQIQHRLQPHGGSDIAAGLLSGPPRLTLRRSRPRRIDRCQHEQGRLALRADDQRDNIGRDHQTRASRRLEGCPPDRICTQIQSDDRLIVGPRRSTAVRVVDLAIRRAQLFARRPSLPDLIVRQPLRPRRRLECRPLVRRHHRDPAISLDDRRGGEWVHETGKLIAVHVFAAGVKTRDRGDIRLDLPEGIRDRFGAGNTGCRSDVHPLVRLGVPHG